jgi:hypothetical protein
MNILKHAIIVSALIAATALPGMAQQGSAMPSPHDTTSTRVSGKLVTIYYGRPLAKGRVIWGELVPWDKAWRLGANEATTLIAQAPINIGGTAVPAGAYTLYMVPSATGVSKLAISKTIGAWGIPVDEKNDVARVDLKKDDLEAPVEQLTIALSRSSGNGLLKISWEKAVYSVEIKPGQ